MNKPRAIGTRAETKVARYFSANGLPCERRPLSGSSDRGDLRLTLPGVEATVEVKAGKQAWNPSRTVMEDWMEQTLVESENSGCPGMLVVVRYRRSFECSEVWLPNKQWGRGFDGWTMLYIDQFVDVMKG